MTFRYLLEGYLHVDEGHGAYLPPEVEYLFRGHSLRVHDLRITFFPIATP